MTGVPADIHDYEAPDAEGFPIRKNDDVVTLRALAATGRGNCPSLPPEIPAGVRATAIMPLDELTGLFEIECYLPDGRFAFASEVAAQLRLFRTREDKLARAVQ